MLWVPFLIKFMLKKEVCGSHEQCKYGTHWKPPQPQKVKNALQKKKKKRKRRRGKSCIKMGTS